MVSSETQTTRKSPRLLVMIALIVSLSITAGSILFIIYRLNNQAATNTGAAIVDADSYFDGSTAVDPPRQLSDFTLTGSSGEPLSLSDLRGKVTLLVFGYTHCPDVCPITMGDFKRVKAVLADEATNVNFVMISVDGVRDTPAHLARYISAYDPTFLGMTGSADDLKRIGGDYGLYFHANTPEGESGNYTVDHTASIFLIDQEGLLRTIFTFGTEPAVMIEHVRELL